MEQEPTATVVKQEAEQLQKEEPRLPLKRDMKVEDTPEWKECVVNGAVDLSQLAQKIAQQKLST